MIEVATRADDDPVRLVQPGLDRRAAVPREARRAVARDRRDPPGDVVDLADPVVERVREIEVSPAIEGDVERHVQPGGDRRAAIALVPG